MIRKYNHIKFGTGVTLVELMIALAISSILLIGVGTIYSSSKRANTANNEFANLQENARIALRYLTEDIRLAGFMGCAWNNGDASKFKCYLDESAGGSYVCDNLAQGIDGYDYAGTVATAAGTVDMTLAGNTLSTTAAGNLTNLNGGAITSLMAAFPSGGGGQPAPVLGSDIVIVRHGADKGFKIVENHNGANFTIDNQGSTVPSTPGVDCHAPTNICEGDILLASDCTKSRVFKACKIQNNPDQVLVVHDGSCAAPGNDPTSWGGNSGAEEDKLVKEDTEIIKFQTYAYYIGNNPNGQPALYRHNGIGAAAAEELVEGIENLQVLYGVDTNADDGVANYYASANQVDFTDNTNPIVSVRIALLVRSRNEIFTRPDAAAGTVYDLATAQVRAINDKRLRKTFTTTIKIRNKGL